MLALENIPTVVYVELTTEPNELTEWSGLGNCALTKSNQESRTRSAGYGGFENSREKTMANRKQFLGTASHDPELAKLIEAAKETPVSEAQLHEQRISFAFGNSPESDRITRETVRKTSRSIRLSS